MATIFNHQPAQQPLHHQNQLGAASTKSPNEHKQQEQLQKQQLTITKNANRATSATFTSISNYNNNNNLMNSFSNNILNTNITEKNKNILAPYQHNTMSPTPLSRQISSSSIKSFTAAQNFASPKSKSESPSIFALTTSTSTIPTPVMAAKTSNISATATANVYTPTFQHYLNTQQLITPTLGYYDIIDPSLSNINTNCFSVLPSNPTYAAAPMLYRSASATQHKNEDSCEASNLKRIQINSNILHQYPSNTSNLPETITTSTK
ncbi:putative uncharacterized protein DDB_G0291812 [Episyrphus balteatus]|uniref:putative uncharacterized protein DDB_G0291812 n=1 Tax=Episyrphus balteatus TaxID=286459 RepID=UPI0024869A5E|nr:putative uncharacterized protein DDB_G0291812 [Episyrphus balteatus]